MLCAALKWLVMHDGQLVAPSDSAGAIPTIGAGLTLAHQSPFVLSRWSPHGEDRPGPVRTKVLWLLRSPGSPHKSRPHTQSWHPLTSAADAPRRSGMEEYVEVRPDEPVPVIVFSDYV